MRGRGQEHAESALPPRRSARIRECRAQPHAGRARRDPAPPMNHRGFTLVEMLVAIGLMALMAVICWRGLVYVADQRQTVTREAGEIAELVRTFAQMERDIAERVPNAALPAASAPTDLPLAVGVYPSAGGAVALEVARFVPQPGAAPQAVRVLYRLNGSGLARSTRALADNRAAPKDEVVLLPGA